MAFNFRLEQWLNTPFANDYAHLVRETPKATVRAKASLTEAKRKADAMQRELREIDATVSEQDLSLGKAPSSRGIWEQIGLTYCRLLHKNPVFNPRLPYSQCPVCLRKYALPWADQDAIESDVYQINGSPVVTHVNATEEYVKLWGVRQEPTFHSFSAETAEPQNRTLRSLAA